MKILQILEASGAGAARNTIDLCRGLNERGLEIHLVYSPRRLDATTAQEIALLKQQGIKCVSLPMHRAPNVSDLVVLAKLWRYLNAYGQFDIIHGQSAKGGALARLLGLFTGTKVVYSPHGFISFYPSQGKISATIYKIVEWLLAPLTHKVIILSRWQKEEAAQLGFPEHKMALIPNGIMLEPLSMPRENRESQIIGFVGRLADPKCPVMLVEAFARIANNHPKARLIIIGDGPLLPVVSRKSMELGIADRVSLPGCLEGRRAMAEFDIFALPSQYEGFPYVLLEAMAAGLPIVATRVGGTDLAIVEGENGLVVPVGDVDAFSQALNRLLSDDSLRKRMGEQSRKKVLDFGLDKMVEATLTLYHEVLGR